MPTYLPTINPINDCLQAACGVRWKRLAGNGQKVSITRVAIFPLCGRRGVEYLSVIHSQMCRESRPEVEGCCTRREWLLACILSQLAVGMVAHRKACQMFRQTQTQWLPRGQFWDVQPYVCIPPTPHTHEYEHAVPSFGNRVCPHSLPQSPHGNHFVGALVPIVPHIIHHATPHQRLFLQVADTARVGCQHPSAPRTTLRCSPASRGPTSKGPALHCGRQCTEKRP